MEKKKAVTKIPKREPRQSVTICNIKDYREAPKDILRFSFDDYDSEKK